LSSDLISSDLLFVSGQIKYEFPANTIIEKDCFSSLSLINFSTAFLTTVIRFGSKSVDCMVIETSIRIAVSENLSTTIFSSLFFLSNSELLHINSKNVMKKNGKILIDSVFILLPITEKGFAKCGNSKKQKFKNSETKQMLFQIV